MFYYPLSSLLIECLILSIVEREDSYGYEISQTVKLVANIKESTLYPILRKLEQNGYLHTYSQEFQGRNRKYYSITDSGKEQLIFLKKEWNEYYHTIDDIIEGRMIPDGSLFKYFFSWARYSSFVKWISCSFLYFLYKIKFWHN